MMNKKLLEIISATASVMVFVILLAGVNIGGMEQKGYGFVAATLIFILITSVLGIKLIDVPEN